MKKFVYAAVLLLGLSMITTSCMSTYEVNHQKKVYQEQMSEGRRSKALMEKIPIYFSDVEVEKAFTVIDYCSYEPLTIPILRPEKKVLNKKFYKKAVNKADDLHGDAVIIDTKNSFRVIKFK